MTSETLNGIDNFTSNLAFNDQNTNDHLGDGNNIQNEFDTLLNNPVFISALNVANYETVNENDSTTQEKNNEANDPNVDDDDDVVVSETDDLETEKYTNEENNSNLVYRPIEKLRIVIPSMSSPTSMHSSSSECNSPVRLKKNKKRFCIKCSTRFKHTVDWLKHLEKHVSLPTIKLTQLDQNNEYYKNYLERCKNTMKRRLSLESEQEHEHLKIKLKIPRTDTSEQIQTNGTSESVSETVANCEKVLNPPVNGCRIRVLRAEEIKQSPPRRTSPIHMNLPENAMVALPSENRIHYECPSLDGIGQYADEAMNEESTEQILKHLLETPNEAPETSEWDSTPNEFISIDRLAHTCKTCNEKFPVLNYLQEHQRLTGHGQQQFPPASILEPIQEMIVDPVQQYHPPQRSQLEHILAQSKSNLPPQHHQQQRQPPPMYGQPPVLPIHQMENQVRNFPNLNQMPNRQHYPMPPRHLAQVRPNYPPMHRYPQMSPQSQMVQPNGMQPNQPINMTPFLNMSPDMYNPRQPTNNSNIPQIQMNGNGMSAYNRGPGQMMNNFMPGQQQPPSQQQQQQPPPRPNPNMREHFSMHQPPQRPQMNGPLGSRPTRNLPPCPIRPGIGNSPPMRPGIGNSPPMRPNINNSPPIRPNIGSTPLMQRQSMSLNSMEQQQKARFDLMMRVREIENRPFISNAPRTEGLPVIESVQSGAITLNSTKKPTNDTAQTTIQINDQITLSVKNKELLGKPTERRQPPPVADSNMVANILEKRGITVKSTSKLLEKPKVIDDSNKTPYTSADAAVQKLQMNNSVSITSKKRVVTPPAASANATVTSATAAPEETIDLSNDDDTPVGTFKKPEQVPSKPVVLKCTLKGCGMKFSTTKTLRDHEQKVHKVSRLNKFKCNICALRFVSSEAIRAHIRKTHAGQIKTPEFGIPIVNFNDPNIRKKMLSLGFTNFLPITNARDDKTELFGMPIININGPSVNNLKNLFDSDSTKIMPINSMRTIPRSKVVQSSTPPITTSIPLPQPNRLVPPKPSSIHPSATVNSTDMPSTLQK